MSMAAGRERRSTVSEAEFETAECCERTLRNLTRSFPLLIHPFTRVEVRGELDDRTFPTVPINPLDVAVEKVMLSPSKTLVAGHDRDLPAKCHNAHRERRTSVFLLAARVPRMYIATTTSQAKSVPPPSKDSPGGGRSPQWQPSFPPATPNLGVSILVVCPGGRCGFP